MAVDIVRRYTISSSATNASVTRRSLCGILGGIVTTANTTVTMLCNSYRLKSVTVWPAAASSVLIDIPAIGAGAEQALQKESTKNSALPTGITVDKPVVWRPKRGTYTAMWQSVGNDPTDALFVISGAAGAILDIHVVGTLGGAVSAQSTYTTTSTVAVGLFVLSCLDIGNLITSIGYNTANF